MRVIGRLRFDLALGAPRFGTALALFRRREPTFAKTERKIYDELVVGIERTRVGYRDGDARNEADRLDLSGQDLADHVAVHVGQAEASAVVAIGQFGVVQAEQVEQRGV